MLRLLSVRTDFMECIKAKENSDFLKLFLSILARLTIYLLKKKTWSVVLSCGPVVRNTACRVVGPGSIPPGASAGKIFFCCFVLFCFFFPVI